MSKREHSLIRKSLISILMFLLFICSSVFAQVEPNEKDFFEMSLEELMEVPIVVSASRQEQKLSEASVPISIITSEDIHYSGLTTIPEILQFALGMDVLKIDRNRYAVGVRGLHDVSSDRTLVLINGRSAYAPVFGGAEWFRLPILLEDIERIEIVRGPGGAVWGANAFNGIINIITKDIEDTLGLFGSTTINEFGDSYTHLRWADKKNNWSWRASAGYKDSESSDKAGAGDYVLLNPSLRRLIGFDTFESSDFNRNWIFDTQAEYRLSEQAKLSFGVAHSNNRIGGYELGGIFTGNRNKYETTRLFSRLDRQFDDGSSGYVQWFGNLERTSQSGQLGYRDLENDIEAQLNFIPSEKHKLSIGGNVRLIHVGTWGPASGGYIFPDEPFDEQLVGLFLSDRWALTDRFTIETQIRGDWYSGTHEDWSGRVTGFYTLDDKKEHILRLSAAKAFRSPMVAWRQATSQRFLIGPGRYLINAVKPQDDLRNEEIWSLEAGYTGRLAEGVMLRLDGYYQHFDDLIGQDIRSDPLGFGRTFTSIENIADGTAWGGECELSIENKKGRLSVWYAYNAFQEQLGHQHVRTYLPSEHKTGITGRIFLSDGWTFNTNYRFTNTTPRNPYGGRDVGSSNRLDLTLAKTFANGKGELMIGVSDLLAKHCEAVYPFGGLTAHETPGRTFFARLQLKF